MNQTLMFRTWQSLSVFILALSVVSLAGAQESRNKLPKKQHKSSNAPFLKPAEAVKTMSIPKGFEVSVFAAEPDIAEPIAFCFDDRGRLWVAENFNYRTRRQHTGDKVSRIQILEDTDSDGVFDRKKTFTDKLTFTSGLACGFGGVFVGSPPNLSFIPDADGDGIPDMDELADMDMDGIPDMYEEMIEHLDPNNPDSDGDGIPDMDDDDPPLPPWAEDMAKNNDWTPQPAGAILRCRA